MWRPDIAFVILDDIVRRDGFTRTRRVQSLMNPGIALREIRQDVRIVDVV